MVQQLMPANVLKIQFFLQLPPERDPIYQKSLQLTPKSMLQTTKTYTMKSEFLLKALIHLLEM